MEDMKQKILEILGKIKPYAMIDEDTQLFDEGILDSLAIFQLATRLEDDFDIEVSEDCLTKKNFADVNAIVKLVQGIGVIE